MLSPPNSAKAQKYAVYPFGNEFQAFAFGKQYKVRVTKEMLQRAPQWAEDSENPPISPRKALEVADRMTKTLIGEKAGFQRYIEGGLCLKPIEGGWVWVIRFHWDRMEGLSTGIPDNLVVIVLMDGSAVQPEVRDWNGTEKEVDKAGKKKSAKRSSIRDKGLGK